MAFVQTVEDTWGLLKNTFVIISKNPQILRPTWSLVKFALLFYVCVLLGLVLLLFGFAALGLALVLLGLFMLIVFFPFFKVHRNAAQTWMVYKTFTGKQVSYVAGKARAKQNTGDIFFLGLMDIIFGVFARKLKNGAEGRSGFFSVLAFFMGKLLEEGWDLVSHFILPAAIIKEQSIRKAIPELKTLKHNVPATLTGMFALDFAGDLAVRIINGILILFFFLGVFFGVFIGSWIPVVVMLVLLIGFNLLAKIFLDMLKTVYFTLFYVAVAMPKEVPKEYRDEVLRYLQREKPAAK
jgi:hypothetical protein